MECIMEFTNGIYKKQGIGTALAEESYHGVHENSKTGGGRKLTCL